MVADAQGAGPSRWARRAVLVLALVSCVVAGGPGVAQAADFDPLVVAVPVPDQDASTRRTAERRAMELVLVRTGGSEALLDDPAVRAALRTPERYYALSGFARRPQGEVAADPERRPWLLQLEFDRPSILGLLDAADARVWTGRRPETLVWIVREDEDGERRLLGAEDPVARDLVEAARRRGLPVTLPLLDLEELGVLSPREVWARFEAPIARASARYPVDAVLTVRLYPDALGRWVVDWDGVFAGERVEGAREVEGPESGGRAAIEAVADRLADRFAVAARAGAAEALWLQVDDVDRLDTYAGMLRYLERVNGVRGVQVVQVRDASLLLRVDTAGAGSRLLDLLRLDARLQPAATPERSGGVSVWRARWRG